LAYAGRVGGDGDVVAAVGVGVGQVLFGTRGDVGVLVAKHIIIDMTDYNSCKVRRQE